MGQPVKFTDEVITPANVRPQLDVRRLVDTLCEQPGRWAEVERYPLSRIQSARSRGSQTVKRYPILEYAVRTEGSAAVLYFRVPTDTEGH
jgi:hypothetical protein